MFLIKNYGLSSKVPIAIQSCLWTWGKLTIISTHFCSQNTDFWRSKMLISSTDEFLSKQGVNFEWISIQ